MKTNLWKRFIALALSCLLSIALLAGCGGQNASDEKSSSAGSQVQDSANTSENVQSTSPDSQTSSAEETDFVHDPVLNELGVEPYTNEDITITIGIKANANIEDYNTNNYTLMMEEVTGVNIEFVPFVSSEAQDKLNMGVVGGETLPDIILWGQNEAQAQQWGEEGYILPLEDYFAHSSIYAADGYNRVLETSGLDILAYQTCADGHIWQFPSYFESTTNPHYNRQWVYGPWLEALNLELPKTTDDFTAMLRAFKTQDPNGNGKADEIPLLGSDPYAGGLGATFWEYIMNAFTHSSWKKNWLVSENGQLSLSYTKEEWKDGINYIRELVEEGLLDPVSFSQDADTYKQLMNSTGDHIVGVLAVQSDSLISIDHPSRNKWILLEPLTGPDGYCSTGYTPDLPSNAAVITADCEHPEVAFRILDTMCREDFTISNRWGKQGENWDYVKDIKDKPEFAEMDFSNTWMGYPAYFYEYKSIWNQPQNNHWQNAGPCFRTAEIASGWYACSLDPATNYTNWELSLKLSSYEAVRPAEPITKITYATTQLQLEADELAAELKDYVFEKLALWCTGAADVNAEWDSYLTELKAIGVERYLEIQQDGWK